MSRGRVSGTLTSPLFLQSTIPCWHLHWAGHWLDTPPAPSLHSVPAPLTWSAAHSSWSFFSSTILLLASTGGDTQRARGARVSCSRIQLSSQSHCSLLCSSLRLCSLGRSLMTSLAKLVRLLVWRVRETNWGSPEMWRWFSHDQGGLWLRAQRRPFRKRL